jgi:hypothetical protein
VTRAASGKLNSRGLVVALSAALALSALAPAAATAGPAYGGTGAQGSARPVIVGLTCLSRCGASASRASRAVSVRPTGTLKIRGRNVSGVRTVIFTGRAGARDDVRVSPSGVGRLSVDVNVPARAVSGRIVLLGSSSMYSTPSPQTLVVARASGDDDDKDDDDEDDEDKDDGGDDDSGASSPPSSQGLIWPVPRAPIFGVFGENRGSHFHAGIDISGPIGTPIRAAASGRVLFAGPSGAYGNYVCVSHNTVATCYAHLADMTAQVGNSVSRGSLIGHVGLTGNSRGAHLHFEVRQGLRMWGTPVNPMAYLPGAATARSSAVTSPLDYALPFAGPTG